MTAPTDRFCAPFRIAICAAVMLSSLTAHAQDGSKTDQHHKAPEVEKPDPGLLKPVYLRSVIDGDSVELIVDGVTARVELSGADAPDKVPGESGRTIQGSEEAAQVLELLIEGERLALLLDHSKPVDALGRTRGYLYRLPEMTLVNLELVRLGLAKHARVPDGWNTGAFVWAQRRAKAASKGIWDPEFGKRDDPLPAPATTQVADEPEPEPPLATTQASEPPAVPDPAPKEASQADRGVVYINPSGSKYHRAGCHHIGQEHRAVTLDEIKGTHLPCKVCEPDG